MSRFICWKMIIFFVVSLSLSSFAYAAPWWDTQYLNRAEVVVINNTGAASGLIPVVVMLKIYQVVGTQADGDDVRIVYYNGSTNAEIDRQYAFESVIFKIQSTIAANSRTSDAYWLYWKNSSASNPPANKANIYDTSYDFASGLGSDWISSCDNGGSVDTSGGTLKINTGNTANSGCTVERIVALTTDARRTTFRFKMPSVSNHILQFGFKWTPYTAVGSLDNFNRADNASLGSSWTEVTGNVDIVSNRAKGTTSTTNLAIWNTAPSDDQFASISAYLTATTEAPGVVVRLTDANNYYTCRVAYSSGWKVQLYKDVSGTFTQLGSSYSVSVSTPESHTIQLRAVGTTISCVWDSTTVAVYVTDSALASGKAGIRSYDVSYIDDFAFGPYFFKGSNNTWANATQYEYTSPTVDKYILLYTNSSGGTLYDNAYAQAMTEMLVPSEWYTVIYEMLNHSIVGRIYRESTGQLVGSFTWGKKTYAEMNGSQNQWLSANLYLTFEAYAFTAGYASAIEIDDVGIGKRQMPDVMPFIFGQCGYTFLSPYEASDGTLYTFNTNTALYKSVDKCSTSTLLQDFSNGTYMTKVDFFSAEEAVPKFAGNYGCIVNATNWASCAVSTTQAYHRQSSLAVTTGSSTGNADRYYNLGTSSTTNLNGFIAGTQYTVKACVYIPSGQGITPNNVYIDIYDYAGGYEETIGTRATLTDAWECLSVTRTIRAGATGAFSRLYLNQDIASKTIYWDKIQRDIGSSAKTTVFYSENGMTAPNCCTFHGIYKRNNRLFVAWANSNTQSPLLYSDDEGVTWAESVVPYGGNTGAWGTIHSWSMTGNSDYMFVGQYSVDSQGSPSNGDRFFRSSDNGATFTLAKVFNVGPRHMHMVQINPYDGTLYLSFGDTLKKVYYVLSSDLGNALPWTTEIVEITSASPANLGLGFSGTRALFGADLSEGNKIKSTDDKINWITQVAQGGNFDLQTWDISYFSPLQIIFAVEEMDPSYGTNRIPSVFCSFDNGKSWEICYEAKLTASYFYSGPHSLSRPSATSTSLYLGVSTNVPNLSNGLYYKVVAYDKNPKPINPGIDNGINPNIFSWFRGGVN